MLLTILVEFANNILYLNAMEENSQSIPHEKNLQAEAAPLAMALLLRLPKG